MFYRPIFLALTFMFSTQSFAGDPFLSCQKDVYMIQGNVAKVYSLNLVTRTNTLIESNMGTNNKINGAGFSVHDSYIYGWGYQFGGLLRIGNDFQVDEVATTGFPNTNFYVGDVAVNENAYYSYRKGQAYGLYRLSLDASDPNYLQATRIVNGRNLNLNIYDFAFHPSEPYAYAVDNSGKLFQIDVVNGSASNLGNVGVTGTFGAAFFDANGKLYILRNSDGYLFRIDVSAVVPTADFFSIASNSSTNEAARCATAPIIDDDDTTYDFGDAPDTYLTSLDSNGPLHEIGQLFLGPAITGEPSPNNPDPADDGISFITALESGFDTLISVTTTQSGYLHAWIDFDGNGTFDNSEKIVDGQSLPLGETRLLIAIPETALAGSTWARFRLADTDTLLAYGATTIGEVEDYEVAITEPGVTSIYYPSAGSYVTLAFEDKWPEKGDYDFNDVVVQYRTQVDKVIDDTSSKVKRYTISGNLVAVGAGYHNGFAVRIEGLLSSQVNEDLIRYEINNVTESSSVLEGGRTEAIIIVIPDTSAIITIPSGCIYFRTETGCTASSLIPFKVVVPLTTSIDDTGLDSGVLDPFIFAVNNKYHGPIVDSSNGRAWEVHLKNQVPTEAFDTGYFNQYDDVSDSVWGLYFQTSTGLPFGLEIGSEWSHPSERTDIINAYPSFVEFAESNGVLSPTWFNAPVADKVISN